MLKAFRAEPKAATDSAKIICFESVRGLAAFAVLLGHLVIAFWPALYVVHSPGQAPQYPLFVRLFACPPFRVVWEAQWAVSIFFVLSGFVLSLSFFRSGRVETLTSAAVRRYFRLMVPAAVSVLAACVLMKLGWMYNQADAARMNRGAPGSAWWLASFYNFHPSFSTALKEGVWSTFFGGGTAFGQGRPVVVLGYNPNLWSLAFELQGSFLVYCFLALFGALRNRWMIYVASILVVALTHLQPALRSMNLVNFLLGAALADGYVLAQRGRRPFQLPWWVGAAGVCLAAYVGTIRPASSLSLRWVTVDRDVVYQSAASFLLIGCVAFTPALRRVLEIKAFAFLGKVSYGLYLIHTIVLCSLGCWLHLALVGRWGFTHGVAAGVATAAVAAVSLLVAWALYAWVDLPTVRICKVVYNALFGVTRAQDRPELALPRAAAA